MATTASPVLHSEDLDSLPLDPRYTHPIKPATLAAIASDGPLLERIYVDQNDDIDWIGRWDGSKTARWAGSSLRFRFNGPLLFLIPGEKTLATSSPMIGWQIDGSEGKIYTSHASKGRSIRLWPPDGVAHASLPITPGVDGDNSTSLQGGSGSGNTGTGASGAVNTATTSTPSRPTLTGSRQSTSTNLNLSLSNNLHVSSDADTEEEGPNDSATPRVSTFAESQAQKYSSNPSSSSTTSSSSTSQSHLIEITLIDWASTLQINHFEMLSGSSILPAYPIHKSNLPTLLFIGDSTTCGYLPNEALNINDSQRQIQGRNQIKQDENGNGKEYSGFLDAFPSQLKSYLAPGIRIYSIAFPGISLVDDDNNGNGMESKFFKIGPLEPEVGKPKSNPNLKVDAREGDNDKDNDDNDNEWTFEDREDGNAPTHIFVNLGTNDIVNITNDIEIEKFLDTLENFLGLLKETYGRRTGDILVMAPFGQYQEEEDGQKQEEDTPTPRKEGKKSSSSSYISPLLPHIKRKIESLSQEWTISSEDPLASGQFPDTPFLEYTKSQLDMEIPLSPRSSSRPNSASFASAASGSLQMQQQQSSSTSNSNIPTINKSTSTTSMASIASSTTPARTTSTSTNATRPALIVRPSSIAAAVAPDQEKGTTTRLHFIDTSNWLDLKEDTFDDGVHPTRKGARKIAKKLKIWLAQNGFLSSQ